jgi:ligand-binding sensor domain-containing protein/DNA-binding CsgD family transcriptional regulator
MRKIALLFLLAWAALPAFCQNTIGLPEIINYTKQAYGAGTQNWDIKKDKNGILYFANNEGLLSFDGTHWKVYPLPNRSIVRSLEIGKDGRIYVGGQEELGYFSPDKSGKLAYTSLKPLIHKDERSFADVWDIVSYQDQVFFRSNRKIFLYVNDRITVFSSIDWRFLGVSNGQLLAQEYERGLLTFRDGVWQPFIKKNSLTGDYRISSVVSIGRDSSLLTTQNEIYLLQKDEVTPFRAGAIPGISAQKVYASTRIDKDYIALATNLGGCYIVDRQGNLVQRLSRQDGIQINNILSIFVDSDQNIWLGLDNGIDFIAYGSAIKRVFPDPQNKYTGYTSIIYNNQLFIGTSAGLFQAPLYPARDLSFVKAQFSLVNNTRGQVWNLSEVNSQLLMGHNDGAYLIRNNEAHALDPSSGFWTFQPLDNVLPSSRIFAGTYNGINFYDYKDGKFVDPQLHAHFESARFVVNDNGTLWIDHPYKGLYSVSFDAANLPKVSTYQDRKKILSPNNNYLFRVRNKTVLTTEKGIFEYDPASRDFMASTYYTKLLGNKFVSYLREDRSGNIWFVQAKCPGVIDLSGPSPVVRYFTELRNKITANGYEFIDIVDEHNVFIGAEDGFYHLNYAAYKRGNQGIGVLITGVKSLSHGDSLIYGGYTPVAGKGSTSEFASAYNSFRFEFSSPVYGFFDIEYSYHLAGFDKDWSEWGRKTEKEYTNLPPGTYTFQVKARNNSGHESAVSSYTFTILPPWYQTYWAYAGYLVLLGFIGFLVYKRQQHRFQNQQLKHEEEQKRLRYLHDLEIDKTEKEIVKLRNEKLEAEIQHKNTELASSAMHLLQKGELLSRIRDELQKLKKNTGSEKAEDDVKKIIRILDEEDKMDEDWEQFAQHFDKVHSHFLVDLKKKFPALSPNELKLCAYLRMNLSTKEIAQMMNISVRGVEISRYRLRKKLQLQKTDNLFEFLLALSGVEETAEG